MTGWDERELAMWMVDGPSRGPTEGLQHALDATRGVRQRPGLAASITSPVPAAPERATRPMRIIVLAVILLLAASLLAVLVAGARRPHLPAPLTGVAGNGRIAFSTQGAISLTGPDRGGSLALGGGDSLDHTPVFSPDGTKLAFWGVAVKRGPARLWVADADGGEQRSVTGSTRFSTSPFAPPSWSPDGSKLVFSAPDGKVDRLYVVSADGSSPPRAITRPDVSRSGPAWSPDGQWIAFVRIGGLGPARESVALIHPDGTGETTLYEHDARPGGGTILGPSWAPDSTALVYVRPANRALGEGFGEQSTVGVWTLGRGETVAYRAPLSWWLSAPSWSPDRSWISFTSGGELPNRSVHIVHPDGTGEHVILDGTVPDGAFGCWETWAPDATALVAVCGPWVLVPIPGGTTVPLDLPAGTTTIDWQRIAP